MNIDKQLQTTQYVIINIDWRRSAMDVNSGVMAQGNVKTVREFLDSWYSGQFVISWYVDLDSTPEN